MDLHIVLCLTFFVLKIDPLASSQYQSNPTNIKYYSFSLYILFHRGLMIRNITHYRISLSLCYDVVVLQGLL
jgi:hypothetical protein